MRRSRLKNLTDKVWVKSVGLLAGLILCAVLYFALRTPELEEELKLKLIEEVAFRKVIYFIDSIRPSDKTVRLTPRQACAIESAAKNNPGWEVVLYSLDTIKIQDDPVINSVLSYSNVKIRSTTMELITNGTFVRDWLEKSKIKNSPHAIVHYSDLLRLFLLWKFGGFYLDTDFIVLKSFDELKPNFAVADAGYWINNAAMAFGTGVGRYFTRAALNKFLDTYNPELYAVNGPDLLTMLARKLCGTILTAQMAPYNCFGLYVLPNHTFYPIRYESLDPFFNPTFVQRSLKMVENSFAVHTWNACTGNVTIKVGTPAFLEVLAQQHCPVVYEHCGGTF